MPPSRFPVRAPRPLALAVLTAGVVALAGLPTAPADAAVVIEGTFTARAECPAYQSFNAGTNPGDVTLMPGTVYGAFEMNRPDGPWVRLRVPGVAPLERWVARECGRLEIYEPAATVLPNADANADANADVDADAVDRALLSPLSTAETGATTTLGAASPEPRPARRFPVFFDTVDQGPEDPTPPPPLLGAVDSAVLDLCGGWGDPVPASAFRAFLEERPSLRASLLATLRDDVDTLVRIWFDADGFRHIFCGEPDQRREAGWSLGGLHYMGRYMQAQENGWAGRLEGGCSVVEIAPPIYTEGVVFQAPDGTTGVKCINGYAKGLTAPDLLHEVTKAYRLARGQLGGGTNACRHRVLDDGHGYEAVFVMSDGAIRTFYPDATPDDAVPYCGE